MGAPKTICHSSTPLVLAQFMLSILIISLGTEALSTKTSLQRKHAIIPKVSNAEEQASTGTSEKPLVGRLQGLLQQKHQDHIHNGKHHLDDKSSWEDLPRLAWVVSQSPERLSSWSLALSALNCYCALHGIQLFVETETFVNDSRQWFYRRLGNVEKYLPHFQWVLHTDLDILPVNYSVAATDFLDDSFDLILQDRVAPTFPPNTVLGTPEVHSSAFFVKNSGNGRKFMQQWLSSSDNGRSVFNNTDNGELHEALLHSLGLETCISSDVLDHWGHVTPATYRTYLHCFRTRWKAAMAEDVAESQWYKIELPGGIAVKVYRLIAGFHRDFQVSLKIPCTLTNVACHFVPGDFLLHGKTLQKYLSAHLVDCSVKDPHRQSVNGSSIELGGNVTTLYLHGVQQGAWLTLEQARDAVSWTHLITYGGCWEDGQNVCIGRTVQLLDSRYPYTDQ